MTTSPVTFGKTASHVDMDGGAQTGPTMFASPPALNLPKGGGGIRGIGEKFAANPVTGTASFTVPLPVSPGRSGFTPDLTLSYDSGNGNGPFGFGWALSLPAIGRRTDKQLPRYLDGEDSDVYQLLGAEDLVPVLDSDGTRVVRHVASSGHVVHYYRPRIEGSFARIERWTEIASGQIHWRTLSRDNVTSIFGRSADSCICDNSSRPRIFKWLLCERFDDRGNVIHYLYEKEDARNVDATSADERNRTRDANRYLKRVLYGNRISRLLSENVDAGGWLFELVFDYGERHTEEQPLDTGVAPAAQHRFVKASAEPLLPWEVRPDPFSTYRAAFEVRTYRRCTQVLMFHRFAELGADPCLVRSTGFDYNDFGDSGGISIDQELAHAGSTRCASFITRIVERGFSLVEASTTSGEGGPSSQLYLSRSLPPLDFKYSKAVISERVQELPSASLADVALDSTGAIQWLDLQGDSAPGMVAAQVPAIFYKPNLGEGHFGPLECLPSQPRLTTGVPGSYQFLDLTGAGNLAAVSFSAESPGFHERNADGVWEGFQHFERLPRLPWNDSRLRFVDLTGNGLADVLLLADEPLIWYASEGHAGYGEANPVPLPGDAENGPRLVSSQDTETIYLADMSGDGLSDLVVIGNGSVCYWPNLGYGRFGAKVTMARSPVFDADDTFDPRRVRLADIDGSGTNDLIYLGRHGVSAYFNLCGNGWSEPKGLPALPHLADSSSVAIIDLLGTGTASLVWSSGLPADGPRKVLYIDLMGGQKPHLLIEATSAAGLSTRVAYRSSTTFYLADKAAGRPWSTRLPFPVHVVSQVDTTEVATGNSFVTRYRYRDGYFDGVEREFRGFGYVEQEDAQVIPALVGSSPPAFSEIASHVPPVLTKSWFHTGALDPGIRLELPEGVSPDEEREGWRALKGSLLRLETYAKDGSAMEERPYQVRVSNFGLRLLQRKHTNPHAVFLKHERETVTRHFEREPHLDPRTAHYLVLELDTFGNVLDSCTLAYGRVGTNGLLPLTEDKRRQSQLLAVRSTSHYTNPIDEADAYRTPLPCEARTYEVTGLTTPSPAGTFGVGDLREVLGTATYLPFDGSPAAGQLEQRLTSRILTFYRRNDLTGPLSHGTLESLGLTHRILTLAATGSLLQSVYEDRVIEQDLTEAGFVQLPGSQDWFSPSGQVFFSSETNATPAQELSSACTHFFLPKRYRDPLHRPETPIEGFVRHDAYDLLTEDVIDALGNRTSVGERDPANPGLLVTPGHDYRVLQPRLLMDANRNRTAVAFDALGLVVGTAVMGKPEDQTPQGDLLDNSFVADLTEQDVASFMTEPLNEVFTRSLLTGASTRLVYDLSGTPAAVATIAREKHSHDENREGGRGRIQVSFLYCDGLGRSLQTKHIAAPESGAPRWITSGWTVFDNKGNPVRRYEPFFSATHSWEPASAIGVSSTLFYDPLSRLIGTLHPDHTWEKTVFGVWEQESWDCGDTVLLDPATDPHLGGHFRRLPQGDYVPTWHSQRVSDASGPDAHVAAEKTAVFAHTPTTVFFDSLGRVILSLTRNRFKGSNSAANAPLTEELLWTRSILDIDGRELELRDSTIQEGDERGRLAVRRRFDPLGAVIHEMTMEAGQSWRLADAKGRTLYAWDEVGRRLRHIYDELGRVVELRLQEGPGGERTMERTIYGEGAADAVSRNLRGRVARTEDQSGVKESVRYDFQGRLCDVAQRLCLTYSESVDWSTPVALASPVYSTTTRYDALGRPIEIASPDGSVQRTGYDDGGFVRSVDVNFRGLRDDMGVRIWTPVVSSVSYNARGQRLRTEYANGIVTTHEYDPVTFRVSRILTRRPTGVFSDDCPTPPAVGWPGCQVQDLRYTYDALGSVTRVRDEAQQTIFFRNRRVDPSCDYTFDALGRLREATGREHLGQAGSAPVPSSYNDVPRAAVSHPADGQAVGRYHERYTWDAAGNLTTLQHRSTDPLSDGWTRVFSYDEMGGLETNKRSNRLTATSVGSSREVYSVSGDGYDAAGNLLRMPHLSELRWDWSNRLQMTRRQALGPSDQEGALHDGERTFYVYDGNGERSRKVTEGADGVIRTETVYLGGFELYRRSGTNPVARETLDVTLGREKIATIDAPSAGSSANVTKPDVSYQFANHIGSVSLELDRDGHLLTLEEYTPFGSTSLRVSTVADAARRKRRRFAGKERDPETGLYCSGLRYYCPWLARWTSADPAGQADGPNLYCYARGNPIRLVDPGGTTNLEADIEKIESPIGWFFARTGYDLWNVISLGTLSKVEAQDNLGTLEGLGESTFTAVRNVSNTASLGLQENIYQTQMQEGPGVGSVIKGVVKTGEDMLPIAEAEVLSDPDASAEDRWRAGGNALAKTANLFTMGMAATGKNVTLPKQKGGGTHQRSLSMKQSQKVNQRQANRGQLRKTKSKTRAEQRKIWNKKHGKSEPGGKLDSKYDVDHIVEKQLGGAPKDLANLAPLDKSLNRSSGSQLKNQIKDHSVGQRYDRVLIEGERIPVPDAAGIPLVNQLAKVAGTGREMSSTPIVIEDLDLEVELHHPRSALDR